MADRKIFEHVGSAHTDGELAALRQTARGTLSASQEELDLGLDDGGDRGSVIVAKRSRWLIEAGWRRLGFDVIDDAFFQPVPGRIVDPTSMIDTIRVVGEIGLAPAHLNTYANALNRCATKDYRRSARRPHRVSSRNRVLRGQQCRNPYHRAHHPAVPGLATASRAWRW
ncbi:hypothetical protein [Rhodococcus oxybenzonivorans]|uniref:hypothetical protein n=1 Tax=Rhodococcus oxybenzonivorans TaxID=1990687 RepID=UPI0013A5AF48|nr:hypothetical protein [Rhodococcus oxybenzonivorans]